MSTKYVYFSCLALQATPPKVEPPTILPRTKGAVSKQTSISDNETSVLTEAKPVPPEPKKRAHRKASISSITNSEKDVESLFDLKQSIQRENNEDQKNIQPISSTEKADIVQNVTRLERHKEKESEVPKKVVKTVKLENKDTVEREGREPAKSLETEKEGLVEIRQPERKLEKLVKVDHNVSCSDKVLEDTVFEQKKQPLICLDKENEVKQRSKQPGKHLEKTSKVEREENLPGPVLVKNNEDEKLVKPQERFVKETIKQQEEKSTVKEVEGDKTKEEPFKPPVRAKGKVTEGNEPVKYAPKETEVITVQSIKLPVNVSEKDLKQRDNVKVSTETDRENKPLTQVVDKQSAKQLEKTFENEAEVTPPKPPVRTKSKAKGGMDKQYSRDTETDQDDQQVTRVVMKTTDDRTVKQPKGSLKNEVEEKPRFERKQSVPTDTETEKIKQPVNVAEKDVNAKQPIRQSVKPMRKEPDMDQEMKVVVEPMRREVGQQAKMTEDIPLLYISEDETFLEALTEILGTNIDVQPPGQPSTLPPISVPQGAQPPVDATPEIDINIEDEPQLQEAAVKIQAAFKGYKTRKDMRPVFKEVFKNQSADLHGTVTLVCVLEGKPSTVHWLKNGQQITSDHRCRIKTTENGVCTLVIKNLTTNDSGIYTCEVVNKFGVTSYNGNVTVVQPQKPAPVVEKPVHPPLAAITPLQLAPQKPETQTQIPTSTTGASSYVESVRVSLWEAYNLTEQQDAQMILQERRGSSLIASSSE